MQANENSRETVLPDGCRDLIIKYSSGVAPIWFVSDLALGCDPVEISVGDRYNSFRLAPGTEIDQTRLLASIKDGLTDVAIKERLHSFTRRNRNVSEAMECLSGDLASVAQSAADLGVNIRSLQPLLKRATGQSPAFWLRLARVRKTASRLKASSNLADLAFDAGYADQAHMTREFRHWFGITPNYARRDQSWIDRHIWMGYGA